MDEIQAIRLRNARDLLEVDCGGQAKVFAEKIDRSPSYVSVYFSGTEPKRITDKVARLVETGFGLDEGRLDDPIPIYTEQQIKDIKQKQSLVAGSGSNVTPANKSTMATELRLEALLYSSNIVNSLLNIRGFNSLLNPKMRRPLALNHVSKLIYQFSKEVIGLDEYVFEQALELAITSVTSDLEGMDYTEVLNNNDNSLMKSSRFAKTKLFKDNVNEKRFVITFVSPRYSHLAVTLAEEYSMISQREDVNQIDGAFTIIFREDEAYTGDFVPLVFNNNELSDFDLSAIKANGLVEEEVPTTFKFNSKLDTCRSGLLTITMVEVYLNGIYQNFDLSGNGLEHQTCLMDAVQHELGGASSFDSMPITKYKGQLHNRRNRESLSIDDIAAAYHKIQNSF
ncbi:hypothetical protein D210916BOD24_10860 [Alteromonas sp. D210916BOD_24]|uniref:hypothetical protein n=1 Tax=Alteromonas sp. D210916BOD_24 TaxID=3157618 RepID=UPI00399C6198